MRGKDAMSHIIELSDEEYDILKSAAEQAHETPGELLRQLVLALVTAQGQVYDDVEEMFAALDAYAATAK